MTTISLNGPQSPGVMEQLAMICSTKISVIRHTAFGTLTLTHIILKQQIVVLCPTNFCLFFYFFYSSFISPYFTSHFFLTFHYPFFPKMWEMWCEDERLTEFSHGQPEGSMGTVYHPFFFAHTLHVGYGDRTSYIPHLNSVHHGQLWNF